MIRGNFVQFGDISEVRVAIDQRDRHVFVTFVVLGQVLGRIDPANPAPTTTILVFAMHNTPYHLLYPYSYKVCI